MLDHAFCPIELDFILCVNYGLVYTYQPVCSFSIAIEIQIQTIAYMCVLCICTYQLNFAPQKMPTILYEY